MVGGRGRASFIPHKGSYLLSPQRFLAFSPEVPPSPHCVPFPQALQPSGWKGPLEREGGEARAQAQVAPPAWLWPSAGSWVIRFWLLERNANQKERPTQPRQEVETTGSQGALVTKGDPGPFMCFTKVAKLRWDYNCSSPCQGERLGASNMPQQCWWKA